MAALPLLVGRRQAWPTARSASTPLARQERDDDEQRKQQHNGGQNRPLAEGIEKVEPEPGQLVENVRMRAAPVH
jgi:hypothetical protein